MTLKLASLLLAGAVSLTAMQAAAAEKVTLQLKWVTQAQFAGYYVAKDKGFYEEEGLDVELKPGGPDIAPAQVIAGGGNPGAIHLSAVMTAEPDTIAPERTAIDALHMMCDGGYRHLPVVVDGKVVGIVSRSDFKGLELDHFEDDQNLWERIG